MLLMDHCELPMKYSELLMTYNKPLMDHSVYKAIRCKPVSCGSH